MKQERAAGIWTKWVWRFGVPAGGPLRRSAPAPSRKPAVSCSAVWGSANWAA